MSYCDHSKMLILHIYDTGKGIKHSNLDKLFNRNGGARLEQEDRGIKKE